MEKRSCCALIIVILILAACTDKNDPFKNNLLNQKWLDQIVNHSDSTYSKRYFRRDFVTATYYINKKDSSICQVMKDSSEHIRQIVIEKKGIRTFYCQYYPNGQVTAIVPVGGAGRFEGETKSFYPDGKIKSRGRYCDGQYCGEWEMYDENGKLEKKEEYDSEGRVIESISY